MTWSQIKLTGSGSVSWRLVPEACPVEFVSRAAMVNTGAARPRIDGLSLGGFKLSERIDIVKGKLDVSGFTVTIADLDKVPTSYLARRAQQRTWLAGDIDATTTVSIPVASTAGFPSSGVVWLDSEAIGYGTTSATTFAGLTRGMYDTLPQAHFSDETRYPAVTDWFAIWKDRRVRLYVYGDGDDPQGDGHLIYLGKAATDLRYNGRAWSFVVDPITRVLSQKLGADLEEPTTPRGIYFSPDKPFRMSVRVIGVTHSVREIVVLWGHYETQDDWCGAVQLQIDLLWNASANSQIFIISQGAEGYYFKVVTNGTPDTLFLEHLDPSETEPRFTQFLQERDGDSFVPIAGGVASASSEYYWFNRNSGDVPGAGTVPRGTFNGLNLTGFTVPGGDRPNRLYLAGVGGFSDRTDAVLVEWAEGDPRQYIIETSDSGDRYIDLLRDFAAGPGTDDAHAYTAVSLPSIRLGRTYQAPAPTFGFLREQSVADFLDTLAGQVAEDLNSGTQPDFREGDYDADAWDVLSHTSQPSVVRRRRYFSFSAVTLEDIVCAELVQAGYFLALDSVGRMVPVRLRLPSIVEASFAIDSRTNGITSENLITYERQGLGVVNQVTYKTGYDPVEDDHKRSPVTVHDVTAFGLSPQARPVTVEPRSVYVGDELTEIADLTQLASGLLGVLGGEYEIVTIPVPLTLFDVMAGSVGSIEHEHMPAADGTRGTIGAPRYGLLIGREWEPTSAFGTFTLLVPAAAVAGYAPGFRMLSITNLGSDSYEIAPFDGYLPDGKTCEDVFAVDDAVYVEGWDVSVPVGVDATVTAVGPASITVEAPGWNTAAALVWYVAMRNANSGAATTNQRKYAHVAAADGQVDFDPDPDMHASVFAP